MSKTISQLPNATSITSSDKFPIDQADATRNVSFTQLLEVFASKNKLDSLQTNFDNHINNHPNGGGSSWIGSKNVKDFGAKGDGVTDDTVAIQSAIDWSNTNVATVYFPNGKYVVTRTLELGEFCSLKGNNRLVFGKDPYGPGNINDCVIKCLALTVFRGKGKVDTSTTLHPCEMSSVGISWQQGDPNDSNMLNSIFFHKIQLCRSDIRHCLFRGFGIWLLGAMFMKAYIKRCSFMECRKYFMQSLDIPNIGNQAGIVDSRIHDSYISGTQDGRFDNVAFFINYPAFSEVKGNFIDFWKQGFDVWQSEMFSIVDNDFQYCFTGIKTGGVRGVNIQGNRFGKMNYNEHKSAFRNDVSRWGNNWRGIDIEYDTKQTVVTNNIGSTVNTLIRARADEYQGLYINANMSSGVIVDTNKSNDTTNKIFIQEFR
ncbi:MAG: glycosyl hydrolase family 28-related protein [Sarcina sp.]